MVTRLAPIPASVTPSVVTTLRIVLRPTVDLPRFGPALVGRSHEEDSGACGAPPGPCGLPTGCGSYFRPGTPGEAVCRAHPSGRGAEFPGRGTECAPRST